ncbi:MAG: RidA family protein [Candidatus Micrarchaeota archaeon]
MLKSFGGENVQRAASNDRGGSFGKGMIDNAGPRILLDSNRCAIGAGLCGTKDAVFTSGIYAAKRDVGESTKSALTHALEMLEKKGFGPDDVVKARVFLKDMAEFDKFNDAYADFFGGHKPARECVQVAGLPEGANVQISLIASSEPKKVVYSKEAPEPVGPYVQAFMAGSRLYLSGQISGKSIETQPEAVLEQLGAVLKAAGMGPEDVVKANVYLKSFELFGAVNDAFSCFFKTNPPAREAVEMPMLPKGVAVEVSLIAGMDAGKNKRIITASDVPPPVGPYSHAVEMGDTVFLSGQICKDGTVEQQASVVLGNLGKVLKAAGATPQNVVAATVFLSDFAHLEVAERQLTGFFEGTLPVVEVVNPAKLPFGVAIEVSCIAVKS